MEKVASIVLRHHLNLSQDSSNPRAYPLLEVRSVIAWIMGGWLGM